MERTMFVKSEATKKLIDSNNKYIASMREYSLRPNKEKKQMLFDSKIEYMKSHCEYYCSNVEPYLNAYRRPAVPLRPSNLPDNDHELIELLHQARGTNYRTKQTMMTSMVFGVWRSEVMRIEGISVGNVTLLMRFIVSLNEMNYRNEFNKLCEFLLHKYGINIPPIYESEKDIRKIAWLACRRRDVISDRLLMEKKPVLKIENREEYPDTDSINATYSFQFDGENNE